MSGLLKVASSIPEVWVDIKGFSGFKILVRYLAPPRVKELAKKYTKSVFNKKTRAFIDELDEDGFTTALAREIIPNWKGLTVEHLRKMIPLDPESAKKIEAAKELPFDKEHLDVLIEHAGRAAFWEQVYEIAGDLEEVVRAQEEKDQEN